MAEVLFEVDVTNVDGTYGLTVVVTHGDTGEVPYYFMAFEGPKGVDLTSVAQSFGQCHGRAMDTVGLQGLVTPEQFESLLEDSLELAGDLMAGHGFKAVDVEGLDKDLLAALFNEGDEPDPSRLN